MTPLASRTLHAVAAEGDTFEMTLDIGAPREGGLGDWACTVRITRLFEPPRDIFGIDAWQALQLSYRIMAAEVARFIDRGGRLYWPDSTTPLTLGDIFPEPTSAQMADQPINRGEPEKLG